MRGGDYWLAMSLGLLLVLGAIHSARAAPADILQPCREDVQKYCPQVIPGQGRMAHCLKDHQADLSPACRTHLKTMFDHMLEAREACSADAHRLCPDVKGGHGRIIACLKNHERELSDSCKEEMGR